MALTPKIITRQPVIDMRHGILATGPLVTCDMAIS